MNVRTLSKLFQSAAFGSTLLFGMSTFAGDHRMFPDEPQRPHIPASSQPNWGYNQTCWQRFPQLPPCDGQGNCLSGQCGLNSSYVPQQMQPTYTQPQYVQPSFGQPSYPTGPMSVAPPMQVVPPMESYSPQYSPNAPAGSFAPAPAPETQMPMQNFPAPGNVPALPPLPESAPGAMLPPTPVPPVPSQSRSLNRQQDYRANQQMQITPVSRLRTADSTSRYGQQPSAVAAPIQAGQSTGPVIVPNTFPMQTRAVMNPVPANPSMNGAVPMQPTVFHNASTAGKVPVAPATSTRYSAARRTSATPATNAISAQPASQTQPSTSSSRYSRTR